MCSISQCYADTTHDHDDDKGGDIKGMYTLLYIIFGIAFLSLLMMPCGSPWQGYNPTPSYQQYTPQDQVIKVQIVEGDLPGVRKHRQSADEER